MQVVVLCVFALSCLTCVGLCVNGWPCALDRSWDVTFASSGGLALLHTMLPAKACGDPTYAALLELLLLPDKHKHRRGSSSSSRKGSGASQYRMRGATFGSYDEDPDVLSHTLVLDDAQPIAAPHVLDLLLRVRCVAAYNCAFVSVPM